MLSGCQQRVVLPQLGTIYNDLAKQQGLDRHPVIVIPGVLGSKLVDEQTGRIVWGAFGGEAVNPRRPEDLRLLALPMIENALLRERLDHVAADGALDRLKFNLFRIPIELEAYANILGTLGVGGYKDQQLAEAEAIQYPDDHFTCFQFAYDWRRDISEHAQQLHAFILERKAFVAQRQMEKFGRIADDQRIDIVAHSMGGLLTRYYLRYGPQPLPEDGSLPILNWEGAKHIRRTILIGTPNGGSMDALTQLIYGSQFASLVPKYEAAALGTFPSLYQLLPRPALRAVTAGDLSDDDIDAGRFIVQHDKRDLKPIVADQPLLPAMNIYDPEAWTYYQWGLCDPRQSHVLANLLPHKDETQRKRIAQDHLKRCLQRARQFHEALDLPAQSELTSIHLIAGDAFDTYSEATAYIGKLHLHRRAPGDGTVTRTSALGDTRPYGYQRKLKLSSPIKFRSVQFIHEGHIGLTKSASFSDNSLFLLLEAPDM